MVNVYLFNTSSLRDDLSIDDFKNLRQLGNKPPGNLEVGEVIGIEPSTCLA